MRQKLAISIHALLAESDGGSGVGNWPREIFLSTLSLRRATIEQEITILAVAISIHALLAESDALAPKQNTAEQNFYPRSPCGERPASWSFVALKAQISIHALLAESDKNTLRQIINRSISIHALLAESDGGSGVGNWPREIFLSTLSLRRATRANRLAHTPPEISIHALLAESD